MIPGDGDSLERLLAPGLLRMAEEMDRLGG